MTSQTTTGMQTDWRYSDQKMKLREECLRILLSKFGSELNEDGSPKHSNQSIYECAHDWISQGHMISSGIVSYYKAYYNDQA